MRISWRIADAVRAHGTLDERISFGAPQRAARVKCAFLRSYSRALLQSNLRIAAYASHKATFSHLVSKIYWPRVEESAEDVEGSTMFDQAANNYRRLGARNGIGMSRNVTYFGILVGLMLLVSSFYLYISSSNDAAALRTELRQQADLTARLKTELLRTSFLFCFHSFVTNCCFRSERANRGIKSSRISVHKGENER